jgi:nicotinate-nucleotide adenylyltransferase
MTLALLGGTFDPVHNAHLAMARAALAALPVSKIVFLPTGATRYRDPATASPDDRLAMLRLALQNESQFGIDPRELAPGASGYTADTLGSIRSETSESPYFLLGADQYAKLGSWHRPDEVRRLARIAIFARPGYPAPDAGVQVIPMDPVAISASDIRARARRGEDLSGLVPAAVANYIQTHRLYS